MTGSVAHDGCRFLAINFPHSVETPPFGTPVAVAVVWSRSYRSIERWSIAVVGWPNGGARKSKDSAQSLLNTSRCGDLGELSLGREIALCTNQKPDATACIDEGL